MSKKFLVAIISVLTLITIKSHAQGVIFVAEDDAPSHPEVLVHIPPAAQDNVIIQDAVFTENNASEAVASNAPAVDVSDNTGNKNISYFVRKLNLTPEQINRAQEISNNAHAKQEELLKSIESLREQAHEIENNTLADFEAILTDEQKAEFYKLRNNQEIEAQPAEPQPEAQPAEPQPEAQPTEPQPEAQPMEPQPEAQPTEPQPEAQPMEPQPEAQPTEPQPEAQPMEPQPEAQPMEPQPEVQLAEPQSEEAQ